MHMSANKRAVNLHSESDLGLPSYEVAIGGRGDVEPTTNINVLNEIQEQAGTHNSSDIPNQIL